MIVNYVKKLVSLNPDRYEYWKRQDAKKKYIEYLRNFAEFFENRELNVEESPKSFQLWLETEI